MTVAYWGAFGLTLFNDGIFWDDWVLYRTDHATIMRQMGQVGMPWIGYYNILLSALGGALACRAVVFLGYFFSGLFLYGVLKTIKLIGIRERFFIALFFMLFPVNFSRMAQSTSHYVVCYFLFFMGFFILSRYLMSKKRIMRVLALSSFFFSFFSLPSLVLFYGLVILYIAYARRCDIKTINSFATFALKYLDFLMAPVVYWVLKNIFFRPYGIYAGYNKFNAGDLVAAFSRFIEAFDASFLAPLRETFLFLNAHALGVIIPALLVSLWVGKACFKGENDVKTRDFLALVFGFLIFSVSIYSYLVVNKMPYSGDWHGRFQVLVPLGASLMIVSLVRIIFHRHVRTLVYSLLAVSFIGTNFVGYLDYQKDWFKQLSLIENFKGSAILKNNTSFIFNDKAYKLNARNRTYRSYEYTGLMMTAFGDERRFGTLYRSDFEGVVEQYIRVSSYHCREFDMRPPQYEVVIDEGPYHLNVTHTMKLLGLKLVHSPRFEDKVKDIIRLEYVKL
jgi:hypothetical protein